MAYFMGENYLKKELYLKVKEEKTIFEFLQNAALDGIWYWDLEQMENEFMSPKFWETLGYNPNEKSHTSAEWQDIIDEEDLMIAKTNIQKHLEDPNYPYDQIVRYKHKNGSTVWIRCRGIAIRDQQGKPMRMLGAHTNITELKNVQLKMEDLKKDYEMVFNTTQDAMFLIDVIGPNQFKYIRTNKTHQEKTGIDYLMIMNKTPFELLGQELGKIVSQNYQKCVDQRNSISYEEVLNLPAGKRVWNTTLSPVFSNGEVTHIVGSAADITERKVLEEELKYRANYDSLTGLANRDFLNETIQTLIKDQSKPFIFVFIDLDNFKHINDQYGHKTGDTLLIAIAKRLKSCVDEQDLVARLGGDEFVILKKDVIHESEIAEFKNHLLAQIAKPVKCSFDNYIPSASIGITQFPKEGTSYDELFINSDFKMYEMKKR
jgi:diguanylate cyclase (GGDEF)-like protein/PAS domain S-box-containing protein